MTDKPWEGRSVRCSGRADGGEKGWVEVREHDEQRVRLIILGSGLSPHEITMSRDEAKTFAAHMMNLAGRRS